MAKCSGLLVYGSLNYPRLPHPGSPILGCFRRTALEHDCACKVPGGPDSRMPVSRLLLRSSTNLYHQPTTCPHALSEVTEK